jgi:hypothetical protein
MVQGSAQRRFPIMGRGKPAARAGSIVCGRSKRTESLVPSFVGFS